MSQSIGEMSWEKIRERVLSRDGHACRFCDMTDDEHVNEYGSGLEAHHIVPKKAGGADDPDNLITVCKSCHRTIESTQGAAMSENAKSADIADDLDTVNSIFEEEMENLDKIDGVLKEYVRDNPVFSERMGLHIANAVESHRFDIIPRKKDISLTSEWDAAFLYGVAYGMTEVLGRLEHEAGLEDIDEVSGQ